MSRNGLQPNAAAEAETLIASPLMRLAADSRVAQLVEQRDLCGALLPDRGLLAWPSAAILADRLQTCTRATPCLSAACNLCSGDLQRAFCDALKPLVLLRHTRWRIASLVPGDLSVPKGDLSTCGLFQPLSRRLNDVVEQLPDRVVVGGFDVSLNEHQLGEVTVPVWQPHAWLFIDGDLDREVLKKKFPRSSFAPRPIVISKFDGSDRAIAYALKPNFDRREAIARTSSSRQNTRHRPLRVDERIELAIALHKAGLASRLFLRGVSFDARYLRFRRVKVHASNAKRGAFRAQQKDPV